MLTSHANMLSMLRRIPGNASLKQDREPLHFDNVGMEAYDVRVNGRHLCINWDQDTSTQDIKPTDFYPVMIIHEPSSHIIYCHEIHLLKESYTHIERHHGTTSVRMRTFGGFILK